MKDEILQLATELVALPSNCDEPDALQQALDVALQPLEEYTIERFENEGVHSALVYAGASRPDRFRVLLNAHLDVIPGRPEQYVPRVEGDRLYGVGSMDMKANAAALVYAFRDAAANSSVPIALQLTTDEEIGGFHGAKHQVDEGVRADFVLAGEPTNFDVVSQAKGISWMTITATGRSAHGAYPWRGENAIEKIQRFLERVQHRYPNPAEEAWVTTVNTSMISSANTVMNKIPDHCEVRLDVRYIPEDGPSLVQEMESLLPDGCTLQVDVFEPSMSTAADHELLMQLSTITEKQIGRSVTVRGANGTSDARHFAPFDGAGIEFGPIGGNIGADNEWSDIPSLETYYAIIVSFLSALR